MVFLPPSKNPGKNSGPAATRKNHGFYSGRAPGVLRRNAAPPGIGTPCLIRTQMTAVNGARFAFAFYALLAGRLLYLNGLLYAKTRKQRDFGPDIAHTENTTGLVWGLGSDQSCCARAVLSIGIF